MKFKLQDLKNQPHQRLIGEVVDLDEFQKLINHPLVKKMEKVTYDLKVDFCLKTGILKIQGPLEFDFWALDAYNAEVTLFHEVLDWEDTYSFRQEWNGSENFILGSEFNFWEYLAEQINLNLPLNLTKIRDIISKISFDWEFLSESDYQAQKNQESNLDPRWEKLNQWNK